MAYSTENRNLVERVSVGLRMVFESLRENLVPETSEQDVFRSVIHAVRDALIAFTPIGNLHNTPLTSLAPVALLTSVTTGQYSLSYVDSNPDTITRTTGSFVTDGFLLGMPITVSGTSNNDGNYTVASVAVLTLTLVGGDALTAEGPVQSTVKTGRIITTNTVDQTNLVARGLVAVLDLTSFETAADLKLKIVRKNADASYTDIATAPASLTAVGRQVVVLDPLIGAEATGFEKCASGILPHEWRITVVHGNANSHMYTVSAYSIR